MPIPCQLGLTDITGFSAGDGKVLASRGSTTFESKVAGTKTWHNPVMELADDAVVEALAGYPGAAQTPSVLHFDSGGHYLY
ncbi:hypothetical protein GCM10023190_05810 [Enteractinococcus fodinae]|nr:hypothetical protein [Enteractinococcus fodinae]